MSQEDNNNSFHESVSNGMILMSIVTFAVLYSGMADAPYGKHSDSGKLNWIMGISFPARISWMIYESPNLLWSVYAFTNRNREIFQIPNAILLSLFILHYINRTLIYPLRMSPKSKPFPLYVATCAFIFCSFNGYLQSHGLCQIQSYPKDYIWSFRFLFGVTLFYVGMMINSQSDTILRNLRSSSKGEKDDESSRYKIPYGGVFTYVSSPHYLGELLEWLGYSIAVKNWFGYAFFFYTAANLIPRAVVTHRWYHTKFPDTYPKDRRGVIPFLW